MADLDTIFKALRLVPDFDGNPNVLTRFIRLCDQLVVQFTSGEQASELNQLALINGILNKVSGNAARLINANGIPQDWIGIRNALINNFADQRDETALYNDLALLVQGQSSPQEFYERCQNLFGTIMTYVSLHDSVQTTVDAKRDLYKKLTLQAFLRGLKDPLGSRIRCMRPETIEKALEFVHEETNTMYMQNRNDYLDRKPAAQTFFNAKPQPFSLPTSHQFVMPSKPFNTNMSGPSRPFVMPQQPTWKPQYNQPRPAGPSRTQQMFRAAPPNYNSQDNAFKLPPRPMPSAPRPMSGVSHFTPRNLPSSSFANAHDWRRFGNPPPTNYFKTREMNFNECMGYEPNYEVYDAYETYEPYDPNYTYGFDGQDYYQPYPEVGYEPPTVEEAPAQTEPAQDFQEAPLSRKSK